MYGVESWAAWSSELSSDAIWSISDSLIDVGWPDERSPGTDRIVAYEFHSDDDTTCHEVD